MLEFRIFEARGIAHSRISRIRIAPAYLIKVLILRWELIAFERVLRTGWLAEPIAEGANQYIAPQQEYESWPARSSDLKFRRK